MTAVGATVPAGDWGFVPSRPLGAPVAGLEEDTVSQLAVRVESVVEGEPGELDDLDVRDLAVGDEQTDLQGATPYYIDVRYSALSEWDAASPDDLSVTPAEGSAESLFGEVDVNVERTPCEPGPGYGDLRTVRHECLTVLGVDGARPGRLSYRVDLDRRIGFALPDVTSRPD